VAYLEWTARFSVGDDRIDQQHQTLFAYVNDFHDALAAGVEHALLLQIFDQVFAYTQFHFDDEEALMARCNYPDLERHKKLHATLVETVVDLQQALRLEEPGSEQRAMGFLKNWLQAHVLGVDSKYASYLHSE